MNQADGQHNQFSLLLDETLSGRTVLSGLKTHGIPVMGLCEVVDRGSSDTTVLNALAARPDLYLLTRDRDFRYHPRVKERLMAHGIGVFVITSAGNKTAPELVAIVLSAWPAINRFVKRNKRPFAAKITGNKVERHQ